SSKIVFDTNRHGSYEIYVMDADGGNQKRLTVNPGTDAGAVFSPNGSKIVFISARSGNEDIYSMNVDGANVVQLTHDSAKDWDPNWQPITNKKPIVSNDQLTVSFNGSNVIDVLSNDTDEEALEAQYLTIKTQPSNGTAKIKDG